MGSRIVYFDDQLQSQRTFRQVLIDHQYHVDVVTDLGQAESLVSHPDFQAIVYAGVDTTSWQVCQSLLTSHPHIPVVYILVPDDPHEELIAVDELSQIVRPLSDKEQFIQVVQQVARVGRLHRKVRELSALGSGSAAIENMFTKLDVHHILDRVLAYFGTRIEVENVHWIRWEDMAHISTQDRKILYLELEDAVMRSPRLMSYQECEIQPVVNCISHHCNSENLKGLAKDRSMSVVENGQTWLFQTVEGPTGGAPLGVLLFVGVESSEVADLSLHIQQSLHLMSRFISFGLTFWDSRNLSLTDELTDLYNQRYLPTVLDNEINRAQRRGASFSVLFMDLDFFKKVNDSRGHWIGSKLLTEVGKILKSKIRSCDFGFRYGGDEYVVILPDTDLKGGQIVAERIRKAIESTHFLVDGHDIRLTVSVGLAAYPDHAKTREQIIQLADQAMYYGKRQSRNIVYVAS